LNLASNPARVSKASREAAHNLPSSCCFGGFMRTTPGASSALFHLMHKICSRCGIQKDLIDFNKRSCTLDGYSNFCRACKQVENTKTRHCFSSEYNKRRLRVYHERRQHYLAGRDCSRCGSSLDLQFHHRDPLEKVGNINSMLSWSRNTLEAEIAKCDVLCASCHQQHHRPEVTHGITGYNKRGCRCLLCKQGKREVDRRYLERKQQV
jgi:hypothetical protein